jgi:GTP pyrophosphokinase
MMVRFANCCSPIPGDSIVGFVTKGRGISVHRADCKNVPHFSGDADRTIEVDWDKEKRKTYVATLELTALDRPGLLHDISKGFAEFGANMIEVNIKAVNQQTRGTFRIEIFNRNQLKQIIRRLEKVKGIENVSRVKDYISYSRSIEDTESHHPAGG